MLPLKTKVLIATITEEITLRTSSLIIKVKELVLELVRSSAGIFFFSQHYCDASLHKPLCPSTLIIKIIITQRILYRAAFCSFFCLFAWCCSNHF